MALSAAERLRRFYQQFESDDHVLIAICADPDALASAMAVKRLLWRKVAGVTISNINVIKRPDNISMVQRLGIKLTPWGQVQPEQFTRFVVVDSQPSHNSAFDKITFHVIIDHHPDTGVKADFLDIRPQYGATASIMTEYLRAAKIKPSVKLATGLFYAIKTDTSNFERQTQIEDVRAFQFLFRHANISLARKIEQADLTHAFLKYFRVALDNHRKHKDRIFAHLGTVSNPDVCVLIADFFMRIDKVSWSFISGIYGKTLVLVVRNDGLRLNAGNLTAKCFGALGSAGGHKSMARAEIPLANLEGEVDWKNDRKLLAWIIRRIEKRA